MSDLTVGALAARTGLTVRTLHHYDAIGLLSPSGRTEAGYRLYSDDDIRRLEHIVLLRGIGLPLTSIATALSSRAEDLLPLLAQHASDLRGKIDDAMRLLERIEHMAERLRSHSHQSIDDALETIQAVNVFERHFDRDQMDDIREHARNIGEARIREAEAEWPRLIAAVRHEMNRGTEPGDPRVAPLVRRWQELIAEFTQGRFDIAAGVGRMMHAEPAVRRRTGLDADIMDYVARATALLRQ
jgi:DNA-binding transcriptional MerR regulator